GARPSVRHAGRGGRGLVPGVALDTSGAPFKAVPDDVGTYDPTTAYSGSTQAFSVKVGGASSERVRITTRGDAVFTSSLRALKDLWTALDTNGNAGGTLAELAAGRDDLATERASVGARQAALVARAAR